MSQLTRREFLQYGLTATATAFFLPWIEQIAGATIPPPQGKIYFVAPDGRDSNIGTREQPWATMQKATNTLQPGDQVYIREGKYQIDQPIRPQYSGRVDQWIIYMGYPGEKVVIDASHIVVASPSGEPPYAHDQGAFWLENKSYILIQNLTIINSHNAGFTVRNSHHIDFYHNTTINTYSSGIAIWQNCYAHRIIGNTVINANHLGMASRHPDVPLPTKSPHEAITLGGVKDFEVAYNLVCYGGKEGIDCKETCENGRVHHNYTHDLLRQGLYADSWFGVLQNIEFDHNIVERCEVGLAVSAENGPSIENIKIHHNLIHDNRASGIFLSRWGKDNLKKHIHIYQNTIVNNGYGRSNKPQPYWLTGGIYLYSTQVQDVLIEANIISENQYFQIGYSGNFSPADLLRQNIQIRHNLIFQSADVNYPIYLEEWAKDYVYSTLGNNPINLNPQFIAPALSNFYLQPDSPALAEGTEKYLGALSLKETDRFWWLINFPPRP